MFALSSLSGAGEMERHAGVMRMGGSLAYVAQQAWIVNDSLQSNVLFGQELDEGRWEACVHACSLQQDLEVPAPLSCPPGPLPMCSAISEVCTAWQSYVSCLGSGMALEISCQTVSRPIANAYRGALHAALKVQASCTLACLFELTCTEELCGIDGLCCCRCCLLALTQRLERRAST